MGDRSYTIGIDTFRTELSGLAKLYNSVISDEQTANIPGSLDLSVNLGEVRALPSRLDVERDLSVPISTIFPRTFLHVGGDLPLGGVPMGAVERSEERRVGKERRS